MTQTIINLGTGGAALNGRNGSTAGADTNDALFLDWPGDNQGNYVYLPGVAGNYLSVPDEAALDITADLDLRAYAALDDWASGVVQPLVSKFTATGSQRSYQLRINTNGTVQFRWSANGSVISTATSTVATGLSAGSAKWVRATIEVDDGGGNRQVEFFLSDNGVTWAKLGATVTGAATSIFSSSAIVEIGTQAAGTDTPSAGKIYRAQILDGIGGTVVLDVDTSVITSGAATSFTALTGQTVTINRSTADRKSVAVVSPVWLFGTDDYMEVANNALLNFGANDSFTAVAVVRFWDGQFFSRVLAKSSGIASTNTGWTMFNNSTSMGFRVMDGTVLIDRQQTFSLSNVTVICGVRNKVAGNSTIFINGVSTGVSTDTTGSLSNTLALRIGRAGATVTGYSNMEFLGAAVLRRVLTQAEITAITTYYQNRLS
jgi:hypothetical protein